MRGALLLWMVTLAVGDFYEFPYTRILEQRRNPTFLQKSHKKYDLNQYNLAYSYQQNTQDFFPQHDLFLPVQQKNILNNDRFQNHNYNNNPELDHQPPFVSPIHLATKKHTRTYKHLGIPSISPTLLPTWFPEALGDVNYDNTATSAPLQRTAPQPTQSTVIEDFTEKAPKVQIQNINALESRNYDINAQQSYNNKNYKDSIDKINIETPQSATSQYSTYQPIQYHQTLPFFIGSHPTFDKKFIQSQLIPTYPASVQYYNPLSQHEISIPPVQKQINTPIINMAIDVGNLLAQTAKSLQKSSVLANSIQNVPSSPIEQPLKRNSLQVDDSSQDSYELRSEMQSSQDYQPPLYPSPIPDIKEIEKLNQRAFNDSADIGNFISAAIPGTLKANFVGGFQHIDVGNHQLPEFNSTDVIFVKTQKKTYIIPKSQEQKSFAAEEYYARKNNLTNTFTLNQFLFFIKPENVNFLNRLA